MFIGPKSRAPDTLAFRDGSRNLGTVEVGTIEVVAGLIRKARFGDLEAGGVQTSDRRPRMHSVRNTWVCRAVLLLAAGLVSACAGEGGETERIYHSAVYGFTFRVSPGWQVRELQAGKQLLLSRPLPGETLASVAFDVRRSSAAEQLKKSLDGLLPALIHLKIDFRLSRSSVESTSGGLEVGLLEYTCTEAEIPTIERAYLLALDETRALHLLATVPAVHAGLVLREFDKVVDSLRL